MLSISLSDMQLITELSTLSEFELVRIDNDELVAKYLYKIGVDTEFPWVYLANKHRNLQDNIVTGYRVCGEVRCDAAYRDSYLAGITERLVISSFSDRSFMEEIAELSYKVIDFEEHLHDNDSIDYDESRALFGADQLEEDWEEQEAAIKELQGILFDIRGSAYNSSGALKTMKEYQDHAETRDLYMEKYDV